MVNIHVAHKFAGDGGEVLSTGSEDGRVFSAINSGKSVIYTTNGMLWLDTDGNIAGPVEHRNTLQEAFLSIGRRHYVLDIDKKLFVKALKGIKPFSTGSKLKILVQGTRVTFFVGGDNGSMSFCVSESCPVATTEEKIYYINIDLLLSVNTLSTKRVFVSFPEDISKPLLMYAQDSCEQLLIAQLTNCKV